MSDFDKPPRSTPEYRSALRKRRRHALLLLISLSGVALLLLIGSVLKPSQNQGRPTPRAQCAGNLRQIGQAIVMYSNENHGEYPDSLATLMRNQGLSATTFICPESNESGATGPTAQAIPTNVIASAPPSYIYVGQDWTSATVPPNAVVVYEPLTNHGGFGTNVLFGDGHVNWISAAQAQPILANAGAGKPPVIVPGE